MVVVGSFFCYLSVGWLLVVLLLSLEVRPPVWTSVVIVGGLVSCGLLIGCLSVCFSLLSVGYLLEVRPHV